MVPNPPSKMQSSALFMLMNMPMIPAVTCSVHGEEPDKETIRKTKITMENAEDIFSFSQEEITDYHGESRPPLDLNGLFTDFPAINNCLGVSNTSDSGPYSFFPETSLPAYQYERQEHQECNPCILPENPFMEAFQTAFLPIGDDEYSSNNNGNNSILGTVNTVDTNSDNSNSSDNFVSRERDAAFLLYANEVLVEDDDFSTGIFDTNINSKKTNIFRRTLREPISISFSAFTAANDPVRVSLTSDNNLTTVEKQTQTQTQTPKKINIQKKQLKPAKKIVPPCDHCGKCVAYKRGNYMSKKQKEQMRKLLEVSDDASAMIMK